MSYTIEAVEKQVREPLIKGETFHSYLLTIVPKEGGSKQKAEMLQKPTSTPPAVGETIEGTIEPGKEKNDGTKWPDKFKRLRSIQGGSFRPRDPKETNSIVRQHSQEMAIRWAAANPGGWETLDGLKGLIDWFQADVAGEAPTEPPKAIRDPAPRIPRDRAVSIRTMAEKALGKDSPVLRAKLAAVGVQSGLITDLSVDQAEDVEAWLANE